MRTIDHNKHIAIKQLIAKGLSYTAIQFELKCSPTTITQAKNCKCKEGDLSAVTVTTDAAKWILSEPSSVKSSGTTHPKLERTMEFLTGQLRWAERNKKKYMAKEIQACIDEVLDAQLI